VADEAAAAVVENDAAAHSIVMQHKHSGEQDPEPEDQCTEQDFAVHSRLLLEEGRCIHLRDDYTVKTRESHLDQPDRSSLLYPSPCHRLAGDHHTRVADTEDKPPSHRTAVEEEAVVGSCTDW
jgi:hypothetical protein